MAFQPTGEHIGEEHAAQFHIHKRRQRGMRFAHDHFSERLSAAQQLAVDLADLL
jgi:hypothetical protein